MPLIEKTATRSAPGRLAHGSTSTSAASLADAIPAAANVATDFQTVSTRRTVYFALMIFAAALAVRVLFLTVQMVHYPQPWSHTAPFGQAEMGSIAVNLAEGRGYSSPFGPGTAPTAWLCPLVPLLWAFVIRCVGSATGYTARIVMYLNTIPSAGCVVVYWLIARHILRGRPALRRTAFLVAAIFCLWPDSLYRIIDGWYYAWQELGAALVVLLGMRWIDRPNLKTVVPLGIAGGIWALINVSPIPIFAVILLLPVLENRKRRKQILGYGVVGAALALLIVMPWLVRNAVVLHAFVPLRANAGFQFWEGNNPDGCVRETATSRHPAFQPAELQRYRALGEIEYSRQGLRDGVAYVRTHPLQTIVRTGERAYVFWFTDVLDQWSWDGRKYWDFGRPAIARNLSSTFAAWGTIILLIWALRSGRLATLPYKWLFIGILFFLPFPYYFALADNDYSQILRSWLLLLTILAFSAGFRRARELPPLAQI